MATAAEVFAANGGRMTFGAQLALAAYHLGSWEVEGDAINIRNAAADSAFAAVGGSLRWLSSTDLPGLGLVSSGDPDFPKNGLSGGVYTAANAAAIVGRVDDALYLAFRGTNDTAGIFDLLGGTPDNDQWDTPRDYYDELAGLITAVEAYVADAGNGIEHVYLFGHSLGGAAVQEFMGDHSQTIYEAITYASIGTDIAGGNDVADSRQTNIMIKNDVAWLWYGDDHQQRGDENIVSIGLGIFDGADIHDMRGYVALSSFLSVNYVGISVLRGTYSINGLARDYDDVLLAVSEYDTDAGRFTFGLGRDRLTGTSAAEVLVGGSNADTLSGGGGGDYLSGGASADRLVGGSGLDHLRGGSSHDVFDFNTLTDSGRTVSTRDVIVDFYRGVDDIDVSTIDARSGTRGNEAFTFIGSQSFHHVRGELHFRDAGANVIVEGDVNGDGKADFSIMVLNVPKLSSGDFIL